MIGDSFAERDLQLKAYFLLSPPCTQDEKNELYAHRTPARQSIQKQKKMVEISLGHGEQLLRRRAACVTAAVPR